MPPEASDRERRVQQHSLSTHRGFGLENSALPCAGGWRQILGENLAAARENPHTHSEVALVGIAELTGDVFTPALRQ